MNHRRTRLAALVVFAAAVLAAMSASAKVTLEFSHWGSNPGIEATWERFNASQSEIEVVFRPIAWEEYVQRIMLETSTGGGPDLFSLMGWETAEMNFRSLVRDGVLLDLTPYFERDRAAIGAGEWLPFIVPLASHQGKLAGLPYGWSVFNAINYNADLFDRFGAAYPDDTWTWDTLRDMSRRFVQLDGEGNVITRGLAPGDLSWWTAEAMVWSAGGRVFDESQTTLALSESNALTALERAVAFANEGAAVAGPPNWGEPSSAVAMRMAAVHWATVDKPQYDVAYRTGLAPTPLDPVSGRREGNLVEIMLTGVNANTQHPDAAWEALKYFTEHFAEASLEAWGVIQFTPVAATGFEAFLNQGRDVWGGPFAEDIVRVVPVMASTVRLPETPVNPALVDAYPEIKNLLSVEWSKVMDQSVSLAQFIENATTLVRSRLAP